MFWLAAHRLTSDFSAAYLAENVLYTSTHRCKKNKYIYIYILTKVAYAVLVSRHPECPQAYLISSLARLALGPCFEAYYNPFLTPLRQF